MLEEEADLGVLKLDHTSEKSAGVLKRDRCPK